MYVITLHDLLICSDLLTRQNKTTGTIQTARKQCDEEVRKESKKQTQLAKISQQLENEKSILQKTLESELAQMRASNRRLEKTQEASAVLEKENQRLRQLFAGSILTFYKKGDGGVEVRADPAVAEMTPAFNELALGSKRTDEREESQVQEEQLVYVPLPRVHGPSSITSIKSP